MVQAKNTVELEEGLFKIIEKIDTNIYKVKKWHGRTIYKLTLLSPEKYQLEVI